MAKSLDQIIKGVVSKRRIVEDESQRISPTSVDPKFVNLGMGSPAVDFAVGITPDQAAKTYNPTKVTPDQGKINSFPSQEMQDDESPEEVHKKYSLGEEKDDKKDDKEDLEEDDSWFDHLLGGHDDSSDDMDKTVTEDEDDKKDDKKDFFKKKDDKKDDLKEDDEDADGDKDGDKTELTEDDADDKKDDKKEKDDKKDLEEDINAIFAGHKLSTAAKRKIAMVYESAVRARVAKEKKAMRAQFEAKLNKRVGQIREEFAGHINSYTTHAAKVWLSENKLAVQTSIRAELAESMLQNMKTVWQNHFVEVPAAKVDLVEALNVRTQELEAKNNKLQEANLVLNESVKQYQRNSILAEETKGLVDTKKDKIIGLTENVPFKNADQFRKSVKTLVESYNEGKKAPAQQNLTEDVTVDQSKLGTVNESKDKDKDTIYVNQVAESFLKVR